MSSIFGFLDFEREGPGVYDDEPQEPKLKTFFSIFFRKFRNLVGVNLLFFVCNLPAIIPLFGLFGFFSSTINLLAIKEQSLRTIIFLSFSSFFLSIPVITIGPAQAGFSSILKRYAHQKHAFIWSDFKEHSIKNFKQASVIAIINFFVLFFILFNIHFFLAEGKDSLLFTASILFISIFSLLFLMVHLFIYHFLVSYELSIVNIYKNALIFSVVYFLKNLGILILCFCIAVLPFLLVPLIAFILFPFITPSCIGLIIHYYSQGIVQKKLKEISLA